MIFALLLLVRHWDPGLLVTRWMEHVGQTLLSVGSQVGMGSQQAGVRAQSLMGCPSLERREDREIVSSDGWRRGRAGTWTRRKAFK